MEKGMYKTLKKYTNLGIVAYPDLSNMKKAVEQGLAEMSYVGIFDVNVARVTTEGRIKVRAESLKRNHLKRIGCFLMYLLPAGPDCDA